MSSCLKTYPGHGFFNEIICFSLLQWKVTCPAGLKDNVAICSSTNMFAFVGLNRISDAVLIETILWPFILQRFFFASVGWNGRSYILLPEKKLWA
ncbi:hypothetical protein TNCV_3079941 [Trichonephila clavipes]|nr:hypothetical protein TNCV_3079941 [Trichonephila clavipes]